LQFIDLLYRLIFIAALVHFLLHPSAGSAVNKISKYLGLREAILIIYSVSICSSPWSKHSLPFILVVAAFLLSWDNAPRPDDVSFTMLHLALAMHILQLHAPCPPSPLFLLPVHNSLPLSALLSYGTRRIFFPVLLYFLPALLCAAFVLSISLTDTFFPLDPVLLVNPPIETRSAFLALFAMVVLVLFTSPLILLAFPPTSSASNPWDRYSKHIGLDARRAFVHAVIRYGTPYLFPPPFNIIQLVFVRFPLAVLRYIGGHAAVTHFLVAERVLWGIMVAPVAILVNGVWGWGWRA